MISFQNDKFLQFIYTIHYNYILQYKVYILYRKFITFIILFQFLLITIIYKKVYKEMNEARIISTAQIKVNITSSIDMSQDQTFFSAVTRFRAENSSMYSYQLELFDIHNLTRLASTPIYDTYNEQPHPNKILPDGQTIIVATKYEIIFYDKNLNIKHRVLHNQADVYDLSCSPDSKLVAMVGDNMVLLWDSATFKSVNFPYNIPTARSSKFSPNNRYLGVASINSVALFQIRPTGDTYDFILHPQYKADGSTNTTQGLGTFTSFDFNPTNSLQVVIGFSNASPRIYNFDGNSNDFLKIANQDQPSYMGNYKFVKFMPDGKRIFSSDYLQGVGLWPGESNQSLLYKQSFLFYQPVPFDGGKSVLGYNWQNIRIVQIQFKCQSNPTSPNYSKSCTCGASQFWSLTSRTCQNCTQGGTDICKCDLNSYFDASRQKCIYNCSKVQNSIGFITDSTSGGISCYCSRGYAWENGKCIFDCTNIIFSMGAGNSTQTCECQPGFAWNKISKTCSCSRNSELVKQNDQLSCNCLPNYEIDLKTRECVPVCSNITNSVNSTDNGTCQCEVGYKFGIIDSLPKINTINNQAQNKNNNVVIMSGQIGGCFKNCSMYNFTKGYDGNDGCICRENMVWDSKANMCKLDCSKITNAINLVIYPNGTQACTCTMLYNWVPENIECGRNCDNVDYVNKTKYSTSISCPCINKFSWDQATSKCVIDCTKVNYSSSYSVTNTFSCICRSIFYWDNTNLSCVVNCSEIWDAKQRISDGECSCNNEKIFNKTSLVCQAQTAQSTFSQPWVWALIGIGGLFLLIVAIVMLKFCWNFATNKVNKEHQKKLKKNKEPKIRKKISPEEGGGIGSTERATLAPKQ